MLAVEAPTSTFHIEHHFVNPGKEMFRWLSQVADNFEEYRFERLSFEYKPVISSATYSGSMGSIVMAVMYNAGATDMETFAQMVEYSGAVEKRICDPLIMRVNVDKKTHAGEEHFIRTGSVPFGEDIKTYDIGKLLIATDHISSSFPVDTLLGHVYADYSVILKKPKMKNSTDIPFQPLSFGAWCTDMCTSGWVEQDMQKLSLNNIICAFSTDPVNPLRLLMSIPKAGRFFISIQSVVGVAGAISVTNTTTGFSWIAISGTSGVASNEQVFDTTAAFEEAFYGYFESTAMECELLIYPTGASANFIGLHITLQELPEGSISWSTI